MPIEDPMLPAGQAPRLLSKLVPDLAEFRKIPEPFEGAIEIEHIGFC